MTAPPEDDAGGEGPRSPVDEAQARIADILARAVPDGPLALLDCPSYPNVGDNAIWAGEREALRQAGLPSPAYSCTLESYDPAELRRRVPGGTILLSGGGNFGDLYPDHQRFRETVLRQFPGHRIVVLPQSLHFRSDETLERARRMCGAHPDFLLLVRTERSLEIARRHLDVDVALCPDMAFALGRLPRIGRSEGIRLLLLRRDRESGRPEEPTEPSGEQERLVDWRHGYREPGSLAALRYYLAWRRHGPGGRHLRAAADYLQNASTRKTWSRLTAGVAILSRARSVITDRLHGHVLALMAGIPHVALDNSYGKVHGYVETWTRTSGLVRTASSLDEARSAAEELERPGPAPSRRPGPAATGSPADG